MSSRFTFGFMLLAFFLCFSPCRGENLKLHQSIDALLEAQFDGPPSPLTDDSEFIRRVYLDFAGRIPSEAECREFFADKKPGKRGDLIERLLASPDYGPHMANEFHIMLMERRGDDSQWLRFLVEAFRANKPWDQLVREIVAPNAADEATRGAAYFYTKRLEKYGQNPVDYPGLVRDVGRMFMGVDVQCAQCHDHLFVDDYKQVDYQGLYAFVSGSTIRRDTKFPAIAEKPLMKKVEFQSVFDTESFQTGPRIPGGKELEFPVFKKGEEYQVPPDRKKKTPGVLKYSPLTALGRELPRAENRLFAENIANRLWWLLMGRGLVEPLDLQHSDNPPSHPELLKLLADEMAASDFNIRHLLKQIALTKAYQRSSQMPKGAKQEPRLDSYRTAIERPLSAKQVLDSLRLAIDGETAPELTSTDGVEDEGEPSLAETYEVQLKRYRAALANPPREPETAIAPTVKAALFFMHDEKLLERLQPRDGNLVHRIAALGDSNKACEKLFLTILSRRPNEKESEMVRRHLQSAGDDTAVAWSQLAWSLIASTEFAVNH